MFLFKIVAVSTCGKRGDVRNVEGYCFVPLPPALNCDNNEEFPIGVVVGVIAIVLLVLVSLAFLFVKR